MGRCMAVLSVDYENSVATERSLQVPRFGPRNFPSPLLFRRHGTFRAAAMSASAHATEPPTRPRFLARSPQRRRRARDPRARERRGRRGPGSCRARPGSVRGPAPPGRAGGEGPGADPGVRLPHRGHARAPRGGGDRRGVGPGDARSRRQQGPARGDDDDGCFGTSAPRRGRPAGGRARAHAARRRGARRSPAHGGAAGEAPADARSVADRARRSRGAGRRDERMGHRARHRHRAAGGRRRDRVRAPRGRRRAPLRADEDGRGGHRGGQVADPVHR